MKGILSAVSVSLLILDAAAGQSAPQRPFPQHKTYAPGSIRPSSATQAQQDAAVLGYYNAWKQSYLLPAGIGPDKRPLYRVSFGATNPARTVSEGQGYGMVIVALMAGADPQAQELFDGLLRFAQAHPSSIEKRLMAWEVPGDPDGDSAFDGDADIAYGLLLADAQWGSGGTVNYAKAATDKMAGILAGTIGAQSRLPLLGDWVGSGDKKYSQFTPRSSDFMPGHFRAFGRFTKSAVWTTVAESCAKVITTLQRESSPNTGLLPDFIVKADTVAKPAPPKFLEDKTDGDFYYNAGRDPWRLGVDALLNGDATSTAQVRKMSSWLCGKAGGKPEAIRSGYTLAGEPLKGSDYFTTFFVAPFGVAAMLDPAQQGWLNAIYESIHAKHEGYFEDSVTLQCLLVMTGNFWDPTLP
jgi:hypothetical protein